MVTKTYETEAFILQYDVDARRATHTFTDHRGKTVTLNHLFMYDWNTLHDVTDGTMRLHDAADWVRENETEVRRYFSTTDNDIFVYVFDLGVESFFDGELYVDNYLCPRWDERTDEFILVERNQPNDKPVYKQISYGYGGYISCQRVNRQANYIEEDMKWGRMYEYSFKMDPDEFNFFRKTHRDGPYSPMFGVELEVSTLLSPAEIDCIVQHVEPKQEPFFIYKKDSSITGKFRRMVEMVSVPCTYRYHKREWKTFFKKIERLCKEKSMDIDQVFDTADDLGNGLHVHVSKESFGSSLHERKFISLFNQDQKEVINFLTKISGRPRPISDHRYCNIGQEYLGRSLAKRLKNRTPSSRTTVCHGLCSQTVEVRMYQGIFDLDHMLSCLDMTEAMREYAEVCSFSSVGFHFRRRFIDFVNKSAGYRNLKEKIKCV